MFRQIFARNNKRTVPPAPLVRLAALLLTLAVLLPPAAAQAAEPSRPVRVGIFPFEGYYEVDDSGTRSGYGYEFLQMMGQHANLNYSYIDDVPKWSDMEQMLLDGRLDLLTCVQKTPENEARFAFSREPVGTSYTMMTVRSGNSAVIAGDYSTYQGLRVGVIRDNAHARKFSQFAGENGFSCTQLEYDSLDALKDALQDGKIDAAVTSSLRPLHNEWIVEQFSPSPYYLMMCKEDVQLQDMLNRAIQQLDVSSPNWRTELFNRYYTPDSGDALQLTAEERNYIASQSQTVFRVAVCPDNAPYSYRENGEAKGILPDIFAEVAKRAGIRCQVVIASSHREYMDLLNSGQIDLVMDSGWDYSAAEKAGYKLTTSYINLLIAQVTKIGSGGVIRKVAVPEGAIWDKLSKRPLAQQYSLQKYPTVAGTMKAVLSGECDAAFLYHADAQNYAAKEMRSNLRISLLPNTEVSISVASASKNDYLLLSVLSKSAESVKENFVPDTVFRYTADTVQKISLLDYLYLNPFWGVLTILLLCLFLFGAAVIAYQRVWNEKQKRLTAEILAAKQEAEKANAAKSAFLSSVSHDLRTPLNGILGFTRAALRAPLTGEKQTYLEKIQSSGELLLDLVNDTLELSRIESGKLTLETENVDGRGMIEAVISAVQPFAEENGVHLAAHLEAFPDGAVLADKKKIQKIILNLLSNAVKYTPAGGSVTLSAAAIDPPEHGCTRRFVIEDTGIGMSEEFQTRLYEPFLQERRPEAGASGGTGLGLSIVKRMVDFLGGTIRVKSRTNEGACFTVDLPVFPAEGTPEAKPAKPGTAASLAGKHVLLCEDNPVNTEIALLLLKDLGMTADCVTDGSQGVKRFSESPAGSYDAVLMDVRMPVMNGYEATKAIRALPREDAAFVPILAMTADAFEDDIQRCFEAGMNGHIAKPIDPALLRRLLAENIG